ncbi:hypothetical protein [Actinoplanes sp. L3-i22]|uniref:hypothetical protein n=1 Tax=Actinoplanes sp. L3-i22 TaxID=2836373 RepID=UPI001C8515FD|nr:hypothetical protein [Actinoplanes sp. L3-i22]
MTEVSPEQVPVAEADEAAKPAAKARRRPIIIAAGVLAVVLAALFGWIWSRPSSPTAARDSALQGVLSYGGPAGWQVIQDPTIPDVENAKWTQRDDQPVLIEDNGFTVIWSTSPATPEACAALADWARKRVDPQAGKDVTYSCPDALKDKSGERKVFSSYGTEPGEHGRYLFSAAVGPDGMVAGLTYEGAQEQKALR